MLEDARAILKNDKILPKRSLYRDGAVIIRKLLREGSISRNAFYDLVSADVGDQLLESNVFAYHIYSQEITFQSTLMKRYCEENSDLWKRSLWPW